MAEEFSSPPTISELLTRIARGRTELEEWIATLDEAQLTAPRKDDWSIQDHLAHLATWEAGIAALFRGEARFAAMGVDMSQVTPGDFNTINQQIFERNKALALKDTLAFFHSAHIELLDEIAKLADADLMKPYSHFQPNEKRTDSDQPILGWIVGDTFGHYEEHLAWMREMLK